MFFLFWQGRLFAYLGVGVVALLGLLGWGGGALAQTSNPPPPPGGTQRQIPPPPAPPGQFVNPNQASPNDSSGMNFRVEYSRPTPPAPPVAPPAPGTTPAPPAPPPAAPAATTPAPPLLGGPPREAPPPLNPDKPLTPAEKAELEAKAKIQAELDAWRASVNQDYVFNAGDMIDPFMPIESVAKPADPAKQAEDRTSKPMIQQLALNQFTLSAIIVGANPDDNIALVDSGGKGYIVRKGILIGNNNGFVREITPNKVVIEEPDMSYRARNSQAAPRITEFRLNSLRESADGIELSLSE